MDISGIQKLFNAMEKLGPDKLANFRPGQIISGEIIGFHDGKAIGLFNKTPLFTHSENALKIGQKINARILKMENNQIFVEVMKNDGSQGEDGQEPRVKQENIPVVPRHLQKTADAFIRQNLPLSPDLLEQIESKSREYISRNNGEKENVLQAITTLQKNQIEISDINITNMMAYLEFSHEDIFSFLNFKGLEESNMIPGEILEQVRLLVEFLDSLKSENLQTETLLNILRKNVLDTGLNLESKFSFLTEDSVMTNQFESLLAGDFKGRLISLLRVLGKYPNETVNNSSIRELKKKAEGHIKSIESKNLLFQNGETINFPLIIKDSQRENPQQLSLRKNKIKNRESIVLNLNGEYSNLGETRIQFQFDGDRLFLDFWLPEIEDQDLFLRNRADLVNILRDKLEYQTSMQVLKRESTKKIVKKEVPFRGINITV